MTEKQRKFAIAYAQTGNGTRAAIVAGYSPRSAYSIAYENLHDEEVLNYLEELTGIEREMHASIICDLVKFYYGVMKNENNPLALRLKAADSLQKRCDFDNPKHEEEIEDTTIEQQKNEEFLKKIEQCAAIQNNEPPEQLPSGEEVQRIPSFVSSYLLEDSKKGGGE